MLWTMSRWRHMRRSGSARTRWPASTWTAWPGRVSPWRCLRMQCLVPVLDTVQFLFTHGSGSGVGGTGTGRLGITRYAARTSGTWKQSVLQRLEESSWCERQPTAWRFAGAAFQLRTHTCSRCRSTTCQPTHRPSRQPQPLQFQSELQRLHLRLLWCLQLLLQLQLHLQLFLLQ